MFNADFYPTPIEVINTMLYGSNIDQKVILEPSAGKGNIVDHLYSNGAAEVLACEKNDDLRSILNHKCKVIGEDFLLIESHQISHIDFIIMNPPFSADEKHILHAWSIAPSGCQILALCNLQTLKNPYTKSRESLLNTVKEYGSFEDLGNCFVESERQTDVKIAFVKLVKPGQNYSTEFEGFFVGEDEEETQENGIMSYNVVRDLVNRYVESIKIYDKQLEYAIKMNNLTNGFFSSKMAVTITEGERPINRNDFKKEMQKSGWQFIFNKMNMAKYATRGLREDINAFVEKQTQIPFTMRNIYRMLEIVIGTQGQRMDKAIIEVFDKVTQRYHENRFNVPGWKTNSHYLVNQKFILDGLCWQDQRWYKGQNKIQMNYSGTETIEDLLKALCYITGDNYDDFISLRTFVGCEYKIKNGDTCLAAEGNLYSAERKQDEFVRKGIDAKIIVYQPIYGEWFDWGHFEVKAFKKGTMHFKFKDADLWGTFNQRVAKIKGFPLYEHKKTEKPNSNQSSPSKANVLFEFTIN